MRAAKAAAAAAALTMILAAPTPASSGEPSRGQAAAVRAQVVSYRAETWRLQDAMRAHRTPTRYGERTPGLGYLGWVHRHWRAVHAAAVRSWLHPPHEHEWRCIYSGENAGYGWHVNTGNGYYGGLQMDLDFQRSYGPELLRSKGTADRWTPEEQMWVAERAYRTRGFRPWPNTARACGLI